MCLLRKHLNGFKHRLFFEAGGHLASREQVIGQLGHDGQRCLERSI